MQMAFFKHIEFCLGHFFFQTQPQLIGNPMMVTRRAGNVWEKKKKKIIGRMSYLEKSMIPIHRQLLRRPRWGIHGMLFLEATPKSEV